MFTDKIVLNYIDKRDDTLYQDVSINELKKKIGGSFDF